MNADMQQGITEMTEVIIPGLKVERRFGGRLAIFTFSTPLTPAIVERWWGTFLEYVRGGSNGHYLVYDMSQTNATALGPHARDRFTQAAEANPEAEGRLAVIIPRRGPFRFLVDFFERWTTGPKGQGLEVRLFADRHEAIDWVVAAMNDR